MPICKCKEPQGVVQAPEKGERLTAYTAAAKVHPPNCSQFGLINASTLPQTASSATLLALVTAISLLTFLSWAIY